MRGAGPCTGTPGPGAIQRAGAIDSRVLRGLGGGEVEGLRTMSLASSHDL